MDASKFVWNKVLAKNIGAMATDAQEYMKQFPEGEPYDPKAPLKIDWSKIQPDLHEEHQFTEMEKVQLLGLKTKEMTAEAHIPYQHIEQSVDWPMGTGHTHAIPGYPNDEPVQIEPMFSDDEVAKMKAILAEKVEPEEPATKAMVKDAVMSAISHLAQVSIYVKDMDTNMSPNEIPTVTLVLDALGPMPMSKAYLTVSAIVEAVHEVKKA